jgi:hypothetical protein
MYSRFAKVLMLVRILIGVVLVVLLAGCNSNTSSTSGGNSSTTTHSQSVGTPTSSTTQDAAIPLPKTGVEIKTGMLQIQAPYGIACPNDNYSTAPETINLTNQDQLTYDSGQIQQMEQYLDASFSTGETRGARPYWEYWDSNGAASAPVPPPTLKLVPGGLGFCLGTMEITNLGSSPAQILGLDVRLTTTTQQNNYHYHLIDVCSLPTTIPKNIFTCPITPAGASSDLVYDFQLGRGDVNTVYQGQLEPDPYDPGNTGTLNPGEIVFVHVHFSLAPSTPANNLIYSLTPELTVSSSSQQETFALTQLNSTLAFADTSQITCYKLQGNTFVPLPSNAPLVSTGPNENSAGTSCL